MRFRLASSMVLVGVLVTACSSDGAAAGCDRPFLTPDGNDVPQARYDLFRVDLAGEDPLRVTDDHASFEGAYSPDETTLIVVSGRGYYNEECCGYVRSSLYVSDADGQDEQRLTRGHRDSQPAWSPDGTRVAFVRDDGSATGFGAVSPRSQILTVSVTDPSDVTVVARNAGGKALTWLDDDTVAWHGGGQAPDGLVSAPADGSGDARALGPRVPGYEIVWSPDRGSVAYAGRAPHLGSQLFVQDVASGERSAVPDSASAATRVVDWTDDDRIWFIRNIGGEGYHLKVVQDAGRGPMEVVATIAEDSPIIAKDTPLGTYVDSCA
jgi:Tol biopolymer transport system component